MILALLLALQAERPPMGEVVFTINGVQHRIPLSKPGFRETREMGIFWSQDLYTFKLDLQRKSEDWQKWEGSGWVKTTKDTRENWDLQDVVWKIESEAGDRLKGTWTASTSRRGEKGTVSGTFEMPGSLPRPMNKTLGCFIWIGVIACCFIALGMWAARHFKWIMGDR